MLGGGFPAGGFGEVGFVEPGLLEPGLFEPGLEPGFDVPGLDPGFEVPGLVEPGFEGDPGVLGFPLGLVLGYRVRVRITRIRRRRPRAARSDWFGFEPGAVEGTVEPVATRWCCPRRIWLLFPFVD